MGFAIQSAWLAGLFLLLASAFSLPPVYDLMVNKMNLNMNSGLKFVVVLILVVIGSFFGAQSGTVETSIDNNQSTESSEQSQDKQKSKKVKVYKVGETAQAKGLRVTVQKVTSGSGGQYSTVGEGNKFVNIKLKIANTSNRKRSVSSTSMTLIDEKRNTYDSTITSSGKKQIDGSIVSNGQRTGWVHFEVPQEKNKLQFRYKVGGFTQETIKYNIKVE